MGSFKRKALEAAADKERAAKKHRLAEEPLLERYPTDVLRLVGPVPGNRHSVVMRRLVSLYMYNCIALHVRVCMTATTCATSNTCSS
jgi:hypothetical protein